MKKFISLLVIFVCFILFIFPTTLLSQEQAFKIIMIKGDKFAINKGTQDGVKVNSVYIITRNNKSIGKGKVVTVREKIAALQLIYSSDQIQIGDYLILDSNDEISSILNTNFDPDKYKTQKNIGRYGWACIAGLTLIGSAVMGDEMFATTVIPVVGPFITILRIENDPNYTYFPGGQALLVSSGVLQMSFFSYWMYYLIKDSDYKSKHGLSIKPNAKNIGIALSYNF